jgi:hypothetical protein
MMPGNLSGLGQFGDSLFGRAAAEHQAVELGQGRTGGALD